MKSLRLGTKNGYNAYNIYTEDDEGVASVFGLPLHTKSEEIDPIHYADALATAKYIIHAVNSHESLVAALGKSVEFEQADDKVNLGDFDHAPEASALLIEFRLLRDAALARVEGK